MRYLFLILTLFCFSILKAQTVPQINNVPWYQFTNKLTVKGRLQLPADTFSSATVLDTGSLANKNGTLYLYDTVGGVLGWHPAAVSTALLDSIRSTGVFSGSGVSINGGDNTKFDIDVSGVIKDPLSGTAVYITKTATAQTVTNLASQNVTYVSVDASGTIIQQSTPWTPTQRFTQLTGFVLVHSNRTNLNAVNNLFAVGYNGLNQLQGFMDVFGMMNVNGNVFSGSVSNLSINKTAGNVHRVGANETAVSQSPNLKSLGALTAATFRYRLQTGAESVDTGFINPNVYDNGGNLTAVPTNKWTVQHIAIFVSNLVRIQRGQTVYDSKEAALLGIQNNHFAYETNIAENGLIRAYLVVQQGTTNFSDENDYAFVESSKFGFSTGGGAGGVVDTTVIASKNYVQANFWNLAGNGLTATGTMGTTSNFPVRFITNNAEVFAMSTGQILTKTDASGTNQTGTDLHQGAGLGTGNAAGGAWRWYKSTPVASGTGQHTRTENGGMSAGGRYILGAATSTDNTVDMLQVTGQGSFSSEVVRVNALADTLATKAYARSVGGGGSSQSLFTDVYQLSQIKIFSPAQGVASSSSVAGYSHTAVDSAKMKFTTSGGVTGEKGGWLANSTSGDSIKVTAPFWVVFGDSQAEGHPGTHGRLHPAGAASFNPTLDDVPGQLSYHLRGLTNMRWYNHGIGSQTSVDCRIRFYRDVLGQTVQGAADGRGNTTLSRKPEGVVIIVGINDIFNGLSMENLKDNLEWMASQCQQNGIRCVILNMPGDAIANQSQLQKIASINTWLKGGVMDQYGAALVDYNSWWNDPAYGFDNIHPNTSLIVDDIHPSSVGYDSLANYIYRTAKLPKLTKALFINELDPGGFTGYSRPAGITINSNAYTIASANDLINITTFVPDSVWIKVTSSTNVTGTTYSGFSHIEWFTDNNITNDSLYTRKTLYSGSQKSETNISKVKIIAPMAGSTAIPIIDAYLADMSNHAMTLTTTGAKGELIVNGLSNTTNINNAVISAYGTVGFGSNGSIQVNGASNKLGNFEFLQNAAATTTGYGITANNTFSAVGYMGTASQGKDLHVFTTWNGGNSNVSTTNQSLLELEGAGFGNFQTVNLSANALRLAPTYNNSDASAGNVIRGIQYAPTITNLGSAKHYGLVFSSGNNYLNTTSDSTCIGCSEGGIIGAKFKVANGVVKIDITPTGANTDSVLVKKSDNTIAVIAANLKASQVIDFPSTGNLSSNVQNVTVTGAAVGDQVLVTKTSGIWSNGELYIAYVSAADTVTIRFQNVSGGSMDPGSDTFNVTVIKF